MRGVNWKKEEKEIVFKKRKLNVVDTIGQRALKNPDKVAINFKEGNKTLKLTYSQLMDKTNQFANYLDRQGIKKNSRVFIFLPKCIEYYYLFLGIIKQGSIPCPIFEAFQKEGLDLRLKRGEANVIITNKELSKRLKKDKLKKIILNKKLESQLEKQRKDYKSVLKKRKETCFMIFTSSTAGTPIAGIELPEQGAIQWNYTAKNVLGLKESTDYFCSAHPAWVTGAVYGIIAPLLRGSTIFSISGRFNPNVWKKFLKKNKIDVIYTAPTVLRLLKGKLKKDDLKYIKNIFSVGEALQESIVEDYKKLNVDVIDTFWQTETGSIVIANIDKKKGALGKAIGVEATVKKGMIVIKKPWPSMMTGIYKHKKMYKNYFEGKWFKTYDLAEKKGNHFYFSGRKDDMIKSSGERISPIEIESILLKHPMVQEVAVLGVPDKDRGELIKAVIVLDKSKNKKTSKKEDNKKTSKKEDNPKRHSNKELSKKEVNKTDKEEEKLKEEISSFVKDNYPGHSYPKVVEFVKELPKGNSGKIIKSKLK